MTDQGSSTLTEGRSCASAVAGADAPSAAAASPARNTGILVEAPPDGLKVSPDEARKVHLYGNFREVNAIDPAHYARHDVKRGLRNADGTGVIAGMTNISNVHGYVMEGDEKHPDEGRLSFRGYDLYDLLGEPSDERRFSFEEVAYLLLMGDLPTPEELAAFVEVMDGARELPDGFTASTLMNHASTDLMNMLARSVLQLYAADSHAEERTFEHEIHTALSLMSRLPRIMVLAYYAQQARFNHGSMIMHRFVEGHSTAETILSMLRPDRQFSADEARMLDIMLCLHAEHGGGNNSTFVARALTSADTDPYSTYAAAIGALKGFRHGGANHKVRAMQGELKREVVHWESEDEVRAYLRRIAAKEAYDRTGLIYGMGHAVYTKSDPRAVVCKKFAANLACGTEYEAEFRLLEMVERLAPEVLAERGVTKDICANVDMYSGFVYAMMGIPEELFTPLFACARMAGWSAHRFEEIVGGKRIMRPAYKTTRASMRAYVPRSER